MQKLKKPSMKRGRKRINDKGTTSTGIQRSRREVLAGNLKTAFPKDTFLLFWPPEGSCIPKILWKSDKCLQYFLLSAYTCEINHFCLCIQKAVFESWRFDSNFNTVSLPQQGQKPSTSLLCFFICRNGKAAAHLVTRDSQN